MRGPGVPWGTAAARGRSTPPLNPEIRGGPCRSGTPTALLAQPLTDTGYFWSQENVVTVNSADWRGSCPRSGEPGRTRAQGQDLDVTMDKPTRQHPALGQAEVLRKLSAQRRKPCPPAATAPRALQGRVRRARRQAAERQGPGPLSTHTARSAEAWSRAVTLGKSCRFLVTGGPCC